jgi:hypothetical protein
MEATPAEINWAITDNRYIAYIDIMGFKDMVARENHNEIYKMMKDINNKMYYTSRINWKGSSDILLKTTNYSDSIIIYSKDDSYDSLESITNTVSALTNDLLTAAIPHKGALAFGKMTMDIDESIIFGQPLIDAYLLQEELKFYGIVAHATIEEKIQKRAEEKKGSLLPSVHKYFCHFKNGNAYHIVIHPAFIVSYDPSFNSYTDNLFASINKLRLKTSGHLRSYIDNTELYLNTLKKELFIEGTTY